MHAATKVLIVDDEAHVRTFLSLLLQRLGLKRILEASNGHEGASLFEREKPDLVLLDISMPVMTGLEALKKIREINPEATVVMLTSLVTRQTVEEASECGASGFIRKDTPREQLLEMLRDLLPVGSKGTGPA
jgi:two-component system, chemotaxis family, chemotaxis protein CheY